MHTLECSATSTVLIELGSLSFKSTRRDKSNTMRLEVVAYLSAEICGASGVLAIH